MLDEQMVERLAAFGRWGTTTLPSTWGGTRAGEQARDLLEHWAERCGIERRSLLYDALVVRFGGGWRHTQQPAHDGEHTGSFARRRSCCATRPNRPPPSATARRSACSRALSASRPTASTWWASPSRWRTSSSASTRTMRGASGERRAPGRRVQEAAAVPHGPVVVAQPHPRPAPGLAPRAAPHHLPAAVVDVGRAARAARRRRVGPGAGL